jgi:hypothetical protein
LDKKNYFFLGKFFYKETFGRETFGRETYDLLLIFISSKKLYDISKMHHHNFYDYLQKIFTSTDDNLIVGIDSNTNIANIDFQVTYIDFNEERQKIHDFTESFPRLHVYKHINVKKVNLDKIDSCMDELFPRNNETKEIFGSLDVIRKIKKRYSSLQRREDRINQLEDFFIDKVKNYLVDNINIYIDTLNHPNEKIKQIKKKSYEIRLSNTMQVKSFYKENKTDSLSDSKFVEGVISNVINQKVS